ncbi:MULTISPECIES: thiol:disulfide interchange protein DsbG [unclassified Variovorax]|uniref:thiol:disulfide interchange protein DsbG n=1 Tax=unclassified Variovorax TaxID=663243 RepID=UPI00076D401C|nr:MULTISPECIES: thiol:disulfide interchange protein DsbG [unclassified Variovorax]KWT98370.1 Thiol:disulfide interchange protein DsbG precursor [Variovorax sp. WDL1]PNG49971.1 Thiol:disulfide interchange protein DsbG [Variovorax sp. B2]PNG50843.1 Thiol:disulfide interchange protein DsbG [Variovorax sp. B4]VTU41747.1 Thiol:disulfide interchange protein DsbG precursor [Variovorax sp. PBL-H6]VTU44564.1 Thiol:disulfide interchange protein DsbG precursor [Variovorax sp. SRS16]
MKKSLIALALAFGFVAAGHAQDATPTSPAAIPAPLQLAIQGGMKVENKFDAAGGLTGWILSQGVGKYLVAYTPPGGEVVLAGMLRNAKGEDLTKQYLDKYAPKPDYDKFWSRLESTQTINEGAQGSAAKSVIYAFMDPNCIYCHFAWKALQPYEKVGLQVRWVPVAILGGNSPGQAAALLTSKDPVAAFAEHQRTWDPKKNQVGITPLASIPMSAKKTLDANSSLMVELGVSGTPGIFYKDAKGKVQKVDGMPGLRDLPGITGLPEQAITDPELQRFRR